MNNSNAYDQFGINYDRFVNWESRLSFELEFLKTQLSKIKQNENGNIEILDAACGTGHHAIALAKLGFTCTGVDNSEKMIDIAQKNAQHEEIDVKFFKAGFGQLFHLFGKSSFTAITCLGNSLPHILDEELMFITLQDFASVLNPGGKLIIQNQNYDRIIENQNRWLLPETFTEGSNTWLFSRFYDFDKDGLLTFNILIFENKEYGDFKQQVISTRLWPLKKTDLEHFLGRAGFRDIQYFGDLQGLHYDKLKSPNLVITAIKN